MALPHYRFPRALELLLEPRTYAYRDLADAIAVTARQVAALIASEREGACRPVESLDSLSPGLRTGRPRTTSLTPACLLGWYVAKADTDSAVHLSGHEVAATLGVNVRLVYRLERVLREVGAIDRRRGADASRSYVRVLWPMELGESVAVSGEVSAL